MAEDTRQQTARHQIATIPTFDDGAGDGYVFMTWRDALADAQAGIAAAYSRRQRMVITAVEAGLTYREIGEALGVSAAAAHKIAGRKRVALDDVIGGSDG